MGQLGPVFRTAHPEGGGHLPQQPGAIFRPQAEGFHRWPVGVDAGFAQDPPAAGIKPCGGSGGGVHPLGPGVGLAPAPHPRVALRRQLRSKAGGGGCPIAAPGLVGRGGGRPTGNQARVVRPDARPPQAFLPLADEPAPGLAPSGIGPGSRGLRIGQLGQQHVMGGLDGGCRG